MKRNRTILFLLLPVLGFTQETTSLSISCQAPKFQFKKYDYRFYSQPRLNSYRVGLIARHTFKTKVGLESQVVFRSDKIKSTYNFYLPPQPRDVKETTYLFEYWTFTQGINYKFKIKDICDLIVQSNLRFDMSKKKQLVMEHYDGTVSEIMSLPERSETNALVVSPEFEFALRKEVSKFLELQIGGVYSYYYYGREYAIDAQIKSAYSLELSVGYLF